VHASLDSLDALAPPAVREELADRALALSDREQPLGRLWPLLWRLDAAVMRGEPALVDELVQQLELLVATCELPLARWHLLRVRAARAALRGDPETAATANDEAKALARQLQEPAMMGMSHAFDYCLARALGAADVLPDDWLEHLRAAPDIPVVQATGASALLLMGDREGAARRAQACFDQLPRLARDGQWHGALYALVEVAVALEDLASCAVLHDLLLPSAAWSGGPGSGNMWCPGSGWTPIARLRVVLGRPDEAVQAYEKALEVDVRSGAVADAAHVRVALAELVAGTDRNRARSLVLEALAVAGRCRLRGVQTRAEALLRAADPLSPREREVADLVARSLSNREVAQQLFLSERTVESHVRSVLAKLGLRSRVDLVAQRAASG
jgi:DNA-binding CsgD family transcriptional regulator